MPNSILKYILQLLLFSLSQLLVFRGMALFDTAFCFFYIGFLILLPFTMNQSGYMIIAFIFGLLIDAFYNTFGLNAFACVLMATVRPTVFKFMFSGSPIEGVNEPSLNALGFAPFSIYAFIMIFIHHITLFYTETFGFHFFWFTLWKSILSTLFTYVILVSSQYLFFYSKNRR